MKAALYARVSDEEQVEGYSLDAQRRAFRDYAKGQGWDTFHEYVEEGVSARTDDVAKRPLFKEVISDALAHKFDVWSSTSWTASPGTLEALLNTLIG